MAASIDIDVAFASLVHTGAVDSKLTAVEAALQVASSLPRRPQRLVASNASYIFAQLKNMPGAAAFATTPTAHDHIVDKLLECCDDIPLVITLMQQLAEMAKDPSAAGVARWHRVVPRTSHDASLLIKSQRYFPLETLARVNALGLGSTRLDSLARLAESKSLQYFLELQRPLDELRRFLEGHPTLGNYCTEGGVVQIGLRFAHTGAELRELFMRYPPAALGDFPRTIQLEDRYRTPRERIARASALMAIVIECAGPGTVSARVINELATFGRDDLAFLLTHSPGGCAFAGFAHLAGRVRTTMLRRATRMATRARVLGQLLHKGTLMLRANGRSDPLLVLQQNRAKLTRVAHFGALIGHLPAELQLIVSRCVVRRTVANVRSQEMLFLDASVKQDEVELLSDIVDITGRRVDDVSWQTPPRAKRHADDAQLPRRACLESVSLDTET